MTHLDGFEDFAAHLLIPSKEKGRAPLAPLYGTQEYCLRELRAGLEAGVREFVVLKGRQQGLTTLLDALDLFYLQTHHGMVGLLAMDDPKNVAFRRLVLRRMLESLPKSHRYPVNTNNADMLEWGPPNGSILMFAAVAKREGTADNLGRSKGINYLHADECGAWPNQSAVSTLQAALAEEFPERLYVWGSTAQGPNVFKDQWDTAQHAATQRAIFIGWWRHRGYRVRRGTALWKQYAGEATRDEQTWMRAIKRRYAVTLEPEQLVWYRYQLVEKFRGDETMLAQEHPCLPEDAFQAFGEKFIAMTTIQHLRELRAAEAPKFYRYDFGRYLDDTTLRRCGESEAELVVYEEPDPNAVYLIAAHPWGSSSPTAAAFVCQVWRVWPDRLKLVAEYHVTTGQYFHFAWVIQHMVAAYRSFASSKSWNPVYWILELGWGGERVLRELDRIQNLGYGYSPVALEDRDRLTNMTASIEYFFRRADTFSAGSLRQMKSTPEIRTRNLISLRDEVGRGHLLIPSEPLIDELAALRRGEEGDVDEITAGAGQPESRAITAAMAVTLWLEQVMAEVAEVLAPKETGGGPEHVGEELVGNFLSRLKHRG